MTQTLVPWSCAWRDAHLGTHGFYRHHAPAQHFATEAQTGLLAEALAVVIRDVARRLSDRSELQVIDIVDIGAGAGELLTSLSTLLTQDEAAEQYRFTAIDVRARPAHLPEQITWVDGVAPEVLRTTWPHGITGVVLAHEWLDDLPVDVVARDADGAVRHVLVDPVTGVEVMGDVVQSDSEAHLWLETWWGPVIDRGEIGLHRDAAWRDVCASMRAGAALAIDYGHTRLQRDRFRAGSIIGYRDGITHWPIPDGSMNLTAHVTWDSLAAATDPPGVVRRQDEMLAELLAKPVLPDAAADPRGFTQALQRTTSLARLDERSAGVSWVRVDIDTDIA